jgi:bifunctional non-homologous end joining protein LigD
MSAVSVPDFEPMLAGYGLPSWVNEAWVEPKVDGWRTRVLIDPGRPGGYVVKSRSGRVLTVPELGGLADLGVSVALDGELVTGAGRMDDFYALAPALAARRRRTPVTFVAFDAVYVDGEDLTGRPYVQRRAVLEGLEFAGPNWSTLPRWPGTDAELLLDACEAQNVEGVLVKAADSRYRPGARSTQWRKVKCQGWAQHLERRRRR